MVSHFKEKMNPNALLGTIEALQSDPSAPQLLTKLKPMKPKPDKLEKIKPN